MLKAQFERIIQSGRVLDHTPGTAEVLPDIVRAVEGKISVLVDGGIRTGYVERRHPAGNPSTQLKTGMPALQRIA